ncbi:hypothetical protein D9M68_135630 [compost metagenome]
MDEQLLLAFLVLHADFIEVGRAAALAGTALDAALGGVGRQLVGHRLFGVVDPPGDDRTIGVAFEEADDHFLADARDLDRAPVLAGPGLGDANPAGAVLVGLVMPVPVEVHLDPAVLVGPDLFAAGPDHQRSLRTLDDGPWRGGLRAEGLAGVHAVQFALELLGQIVQAGLVGVLMDAITGADHQILAVLVGALVATEFEQVSRAQATGVAAQLHALELGVDGFDAGARIVLAVLALHVFAGVVVQRVVGVAVGARHRGAHLQARRRALEVVIVQRQGAGLHLAGQLPVEEVIALAHLQVRRVVGHRGVAVDAGVGAIGVGEHQHVAVLLVAEVVVDAFLLHQPTDEVEAALAVLHAVFPLAVAGAQAVLEIGEAQVAEDLLDDVRHRAVLEDAAVRGPREQPEPGAQHHLVAGELAGAGVLPATGDDAVEVALATIGQLQGQPHGLAEQLVELHRAVFRCQLQLVVERPAERLVAV